MLLVLAVLVTVSGGVVFDEAPLPGATVQLTNGTLTRTAVSDVEGRYSFAGVAAGTYDLKCELAGMETTEARVTVGDEETELPLQRMTVSPADMITINCNFRGCTDDAPVSEYDRPLCSDVDLHDALIVAIDNGDRSAAELLRARYSITLSARERHRLAGALLGRVADDTSLWNELLARAELCVRFPRRGDEYSAAFLAWCAARNLPAEEHWWTSYDALTAAGSDARSRVLLLDALATNDEALVATAVAALAQQRDERARPLVEAALKRFPDIATYLDDDTRADYLGQRADSQQR